MRLIGLLIVYVVLAWLLGFWPFEEGFFTGPTSACSYDAGYDDGYDGAAPKCSIEAYLEGYDDGDFDSECHWLRCERPDYDKFKKMGCGSWTQMECW